MKAGGGRHLLVQLKCCKTSSASVEFIPKGEIPICPEDFRPISMTSVLARAMHKILPRRMMNMLEFSDFQFAFLKRDGCLEASMLLHSILRNAHDSTKAMAMLSLDISKAFDTISHDAVLKSARKAGLPAPLVKYLHHLFSTAKTYVGEGSTRCGRGVTEGDPLSPILFVLVMNEA